MCCACDGSCNHVGQHAYCPAHGGSAEPVWTFTSTNTMQTLPIPLTEERVRQIIRDEFNKVARELQSAPPDGPRTPEP